jgi:transcriptional regulator with XRE-family HTH domain
MNDFEEIKNKTPLEIQIFIEKSFDIIDEIDFILDKKKINRSNLADKLEKSDSEISKWFSGLHNLTIKTISKIEATLEETIITTPSKFESETKLKLKNALKKIAHLEKRINKLEEENNLLNDIIGLDFDDYQTKNVKSISNFFQIENSINTNLNFKDQKITDDQFYKAKPIYYNPQKTKNYPKTFEESI